MGHTTTLNETLRSVLDGTENVRLATPGANWRTTVAALRGTTAITSSAINQTLIDSLPDGTIIVVPDGATISAISLIARKIHFAFGPGTINIAGTISLNTCTGISLIGKGMGNPGHGGTQFQWTANNNTIPIFKLAHCQHVVFSDFSVVTSQFNRANAAFWTMAFDSGASPPGLNPTEGIWENIIIEGTDTLGLKYGFRIGVPPPTPGDNDEFNQFTRVTVNNYWQAGWSIEQAESKSNSFHDCGFLGNSTGKYGVTTAENGGFGGSFIWRGGGGGGNVNADFWLGQVDDFISIEDFNTEGSARLLQSDVPSSGAWCVHLKNGRFAGNNLNADGHAIYFTNRGPLIVEQVAFENVGATTALDLYIDMTGNPTPPPTTRGIALAIGCSIGSTLSNPLVTANSNNGRWYNLGSVVDPGGDAIPLPFTLAPVLNYSQLTTSPNRGMLAIVDDALVNIPGQRVAAGGGSNSVLVGAVDSSGNYFIVGAVPIGPVTVTVSTYTVTGADRSIICNNINSPGQVTLTLPTASACLGRRLTIKTVPANTVVSASSNVTQRGSTSQSTAILASGAGNWAELESDGSFWVIMAGS